ncbi:MULTISPECIES: hypothetical protein [Paenibacillus]|uniref:hypothetical protein n=1 Tax=Paenibacillus TaxID=44249 RepID=UPI000B839EF8|nr:hypothetical protein [Paenibacillus amylolyticus]
MKKLMFVLSFAILVIGSLGCSSENEKDFRDVSWGTKIDKVISAEEKNGNLGYEEDVHNDHEKSIEYSNLVVLGKKADAKYVFTDLLDNDGILEMMEEGSELSEELNNPNTTETRKEEIYKIMDQRLEEMENAADAYPLDDFLMIEASYDFGTLTNKDSDEILEELTNKYGKPELESYNNSFIYNWTSDRSTIEYWTKSSSIKYKARYSIMEKFADVDKYNKKLNSKTSKDEL